MAEAVDQLERLRGGLAGQYDVEKVVGQGGMATVYLAHDAKHGRKVAIKVLKPELAASLGHERFLREIKLAAQLQHPNILGFYESGEAAGLVYYVMPFVEGESLRDRLDKERQLAIEDAVRIVRESAEALGYAHGHGIVHRDIKPENILLIGGHAVVADFGIAKAVEAAGGEKLTETGMAVGTPHYMSPEQALGGALDGRSDQYALGCVAYELLVGQPPFDGPNPMAVLARHAMEQVPSMQVVRNTIPDSVEDAIMRALSKTPADRFPSMKEFIEALEDAEADVAIQRTAARRAATQPRLAARTPGGTRATTPIDVPTVAARPWKKAIPVALAALALVGGGLAFLKVRGGGAAAPVAADASSDARKVAVLYFEDQSPNGALRYLADGLTEDLIQELSTVQTLNVVSRNGVSSYRDGSTPRDSVARALQVGTLVLGSVEPSGADKIRVTTRLVDASGTEISRSSFEQPAGDPLAMREMLKGRVSESLRERLGEEVRLREQRSTTKSTEAWVLMQRAEQTRKGAEAAVLSGDSTGATTRFLEADSIARLATEKDPAWNEPVVFRGRIFYRRSRLSLSNPEQAGGLIDQGLGFAETALGRDNADPDALELRGNLRYWKYLMRLEQDPARAKALFADAKKDLEQSTRLKPTQAGAWGSLSHLYARDTAAGETDVVLAARRAYESDAYLENAPKVVERLFTGYYDLDQAVDAAHWCDEGARRFPQNQAFVTCQLYLMTMRGRNPDPAKAWELAASPALTSDPTGGQPEYRKRRAQMLVAAVLARAGLADSAKAVAARSLADADVDPTKFLYLEQAFVHTILKDNTGAVQALKTYFAANPDARVDFARDPGWRFRDLAADPAFKALVGAP